MVMRERNGMVGRSPYLDQIITKKNSACNMQIVFVDIVSYSKRNSHAQVEVINAFRQCMEAALSATAQHFAAFLQTARLGLRENVILVPAGDGAAVGLPFDGLHDAHLVFATALLHEIGVRSATADCARFRRQNWCDCHDAMRVRVGVSEGKVIVYKDINENFNIAGTTMNIAARVMGVAGANEILFSEEAYEQFKDMTRGVAGNFIGYKGVVVKHGLTLTVYQYVNKRIKYLYVARNLSRGVLVPPRAPGKTLVTLKTADRASSKDAEAGHPTRKSTKSHVERAAPANPICVEAYERLVAITAGSCTVGQKNERAEIIITRPFMIDRFPMTQGLYQRVMGRCYSHFKGDTLPVESVTWFDAVTFCNALSRLCLRDEVYTLSDKDVLIDYSASGFRLPTEAEWEYAYARGGIAPDNDDLGAVAWYRVNAKQTQAVGQLGPNAHGLYDMLGNVWEWCNDWYEKRQANAVLTDPAGPTEGLERLVRGGSWNDLAANVTATYRSTRDPSSRLPNLGFRVALTTALVAGEEGEV